MTDDDLAILTRGFALDVKAALDTTRAELRAEFKALLVTALADLVPAVGPKGDVGDRGPAGESGPAGRDGAIGPAGPPGPAGTDGRDGAKGDPGDTGPVGPRGAAGEDGKPGDVGPAGPAGRDGRDGQAGVQGPAGKDGANGLDGKDGAPGMNGKDGADGLGFDGAELTFDEATGYALTLTAGGRSKSFPLPLPDYKGVWKYGAYHKAAYVTKDGNQFIALQDTLPGDQPGQSAKWRLAVRRGQDGKDAK